jgi:hypothetical protein
MATQLAQLTGTWRRYLEVYPASCLHVALIISSIHSTDTCEFSLLSRKLASSS